MGFRAWFEQRLVSSWWRKRGLWAWAFKDLSLLVGWIAARRRNRYLSGRQPAVQLGVPLLVVGNVVAGGAGKTPVVMALAQRYRARGLQMGIIARGVNGKTTVQAVLPTSDPAQVGDEPLLLAQRTGCPVWVGADRVAAARALLQAHPNTQLIISDDGLQHLALGRSAEVIVFDERGIGNGWTLPAGPLREPWPRTAHVGVPVVMLSRGAFPADAHRVVRELAAHAVRADGSTRTLVDLRDQACHALAGIAQPQAFFDMLRAAGLTLASTEALPDHYQFDSYKAQKHGDTLGKSSENRPELVLLCTEKDAVKLWRTHPQAWAVPLVTRIPDAALDAIDRALFS